jgi:general stress protein CsbA
MTKNQSVDKNIKDVSIDKMRFQQNKFSANFVLLGLVLSLIGLFTMINFNQYIVSGTNIHVIPDMRIGIEIGVAIVLMLMTFMASEKVKFYDTFWSYYGLFILAGINLLRIFNIPFYIYGIYDSTIEPMITKTAFRWVVAAFALSSICFTIAGLMALKRVKTLNKYIKEMKTHGHNEI